jgi:hypothetical protein
MKLRDSALTLAFLGLGLVLLSPSSAVAAPAQPPAAAPYPDYGWGPGGPHPALRALIDKTQNDLRMAEQLEPNKPDARERYRHAQGHLSTFDRKLVHGHFDNGELKDAIHDIKQILDKNVLQASSRTALSDDLAQLEIVRDRH